tara:strand:- start:847 stop:1050 length:204 start_codon:yes stop_codon:yes gene_type:complete
MKKYTVLKGCGIAGTFHEPGDTVEVSEKDAPGLLAAQQITHHANVEKPVDRSVGLKKSTTKTKKRSK